MIPFVLFAVPLLFILAIACLGAVLSKYTGDRWL